MIADAPRAVMNAALAAEQKAARAVDKANDSPYTRPIPAKGVAPQPIS